MLGVDSKWLAFDKQEIKTQTTPGHVLGDWASYRGTTSQPRATNHPDRGHIVCTAAQHSQSFQPRIDYAEHRSEKPTCLLSALLPLS